MDFWSRLIGGIGNSTASQPAPYRSSEQRLGRFSRAKEQLQQSVPKNKKPSTDILAVENARICLESLKHILQEEIQSPAPHVCIAHAAKFRVYNTIAHVALSSCNDGVIREGLDFFNTLIDSEEGDFLEDVGFANALTTFIDEISSSDSILASSPTEGAIVVILFGIASKLRLQPDLLRVWFRPYIQDARNPYEYSPGGLSASRSGRLEFPLFYFLLDYVHHDRRIGDFARTGLLYIIESAVHSEELERWIVESDLATLMASGLGALYSQLSRCASMRVFSEHLVHIAKQIRKIVLSFAKDFVPAVVAFSEVSHSASAYDAVETSSPEFQAHLGTFLSYFMFWQDVLEHCTSDDVKQGLLDHFQILFLQQLLYPSLVESSDRDGGSSVAVLTYLRCIIESINHPDLIRLILQYLFALPEAPKDDNPIARPTTLLRRRKSQTLIAHLAKGEEKPSPTLFTLVDLILTSLGSRNQQTVTCTLRLCTAMIRTQHQHTISSLIRVQPPFSQRTIGAHNADVDMLFSMAKEIGTYHGLQESYESHMQDVRNLMEMHSCSSRLLALPGFEIFADQIAAKHISPNSETVMAHTISVEDPLLRSLLSLLDSFFVNDIETNLSLTQTLTTLASCGYTRVDGWLLGNGSDDVYPSDQEMSSDEDADAAQHTRNTSSNGSNANKANLRAIKMARREPVRHPSSTSPVFAVLHSLVQKIDFFRQKIQDFDTYLAERKHIFKVGEEIETALSEPPIRVRSSKKGTPAPATPLNSPPNNLIGTISRRLFSEGETSSNNPSRSSSPRGRQQRDASSSAALVGRLNHLRLSPSPNPSKKQQQSRNFSASPLRRPKNNNPPASATPPQVVTPMGPPDVLLQKIKMPTTTITAAAVSPAVSPLPPPPPPPLPRFTPTAMTASSNAAIGSGAGSDASSVRSDSFILAGSGPLEEEAREVSLGHLLTNIVILQEFVLELAALVEVRATLFEDEVRFM